MKLNTICVPQKMQEASLSQGGLRDAAVHFIRIEFYNGIARFLCHSTAFLYSPTSATIQMLKLKQYADFHGSDMKHGDSRKSLHRAHER